jgi:uncharacterized membrane protein YtjA (UPF0391 family)
MIGGTICALLHRHTGGQPYARPGDASTASAKSGGPRAPPVRNAVVRRTFFQASPTGRAVLLFPRVAEKLIVAGKICPRIVFISRVADGGECQGSAGPRKPLWHRGCYPLHSERNGGHMLHYALIFFVIALIAAVLGMRGVAGLSAEIGYVFVVVAVVFLVIALLTGRTPPVVP